MRKRKKYGNGTPVTNYIENPYEVLQEDKIDKAEAVYKAESSTGTQIMDVIGQAMMQYGMSQGGMSGISDLSTAMKAENTMGNGGSVGGPGDPIKTLTGGEGFPVTPEYAAAYKKATGNDIPADAYLTQNMLDDFELTGQAVTFEQPVPEVVEITPEVEDTPAPPVTTQPKFRRIPISERGNVGDVYVPDTPEYKAYGPKKPMSAEDWKKTEYYKANQVQKDKAGFKLGEFPFQDEPNLKDDPNKFLYKGDWKNQWLINQANPPVPIIEDAPIDDTAVVTGAYGMDLNYAYGGNVPVEIEGEEVVETPDGQLLDVEGPSHEEGGIDTSLPPGSKVYSDRIKIAGKSMQERKKTREKKQTDLERLLGGNSSDVILKGSLNRVTDTNAEQEKQDMTIQMIVDTVMNGQPMKKAYGGKVDKPTYQNGTPPGGVPRQGEFLEDEFTDLYQASLPQVDPALLAIQNMTGYDPNMTMGEYNEIMGNKSEPIGALPTKSAQPMTQWELPASSSKGPVLTTSPYLDDEEKDQGGQGSRGAMPTTGDLTSIAGNLVSSFGPYLNTLRNRASDSPNINPYRDFGIEGLEKFEEAEQYIQGMRENKLRDAELAKTSALKRARNSARGVNTLRALDLATEQGFQQGERDIYDQFASQMMGILGQEAQGEFLQDKMVMQGEGTRDIYDRMDNDNFATQMATNIVGIGEGLQETGKDINTIKEREVMMNLINQLSKYGIKVDEQGNVIQG